MLSAQTVNDGIQSLGTLVEMVSNNGFLIVFSVVSLAFNLYVLRQFIIGGLVSGKLYDAAIKEINYYKKRMDRERDNVWQKVLGYLSGLKAAPNQEEVSTNATLRDEPKK